MLKVKFMSNLRSILGKKSIELYLDKEKNIDEILDEIGKVVNSKFEVLSKEKDYINIKLFIEIMGKMSFITMKVKFLYNNEFISLDKKILDGELQVLPLLGGG
ncbi:hypothetical protein JCM30566_06990 [Marinitoga arctica]